MTTSCVASATATSRWCSGVASPRASCPSSTSITWRLRARGLRVPDDIALVGFDDLPISEFVDPALTTVRVPARAIGAQAAAMLIELITSHVEPESHFLPTELVIRESCGARRDAGSQRNGHRARIAAAAGEPHQRQ